MKLRDGSVDSSNDAELLLVRRIARADRDALSQLFLRYHARLFRFVFRVTGSYSIAEELVNDVLLAVWRKADSFRAKSKVSTWIFGIAYRMATKQLARRRTRLMRFPFVEDGYVDQLVDTQTGSAMETEEQVMWSVDQLPTAQRLTVLLTFYVGLSYEETAEVTGVPVNTVKTRMYHARRKLKHVLKDEGYT